MMEEQGIVSLWLGEAESSEELDEALQIVYSEDGDFDGSEFTRGFGIGFYDENFKESEFFEEHLDSLESLLEGFSCDNVIIPRFSTIAAPLSGKFNAVMLLYNFRYDANVMEWQNDQVHLQFIGTASYET